MFRYLNQNPYGRNVEDCAVRSISLVENKPYAVTYRELSEFALNHGRMLSSVENIEEFLDSKYSRICFDEMTLDEFMSRYSKGKFLITMPRTHNGSNKSGLIMTHFKMERNSFGVRGEFKINKNFYEPPSRFDISVAGLQLMDLMLNMGQTSNDVILKKLKHQDNHYLDKIVEQNETIIQQNNTIIDMLKRL